MQITFHRGTAPDAFINDTNNICPITVKTNNITLRKLPIELMCQGLYFNMKFSCNLFVHSYVDIPSVCLGEMSLNAMYLTLIKIK